MLAEKPALALNYNLNKIKIRIRSIQMVQAQAQPFKFQEVFNLTTKGLNPENFKMGMMTFESPKYICIKEASVS